MLGSDEGLLRLPPVELVAIIRRLEARIEEQDRRIAALEKQVRESRQSRPPFSKGGRKDKPGRPGRKTGQGRFANRPEPEPQPRDTVEDIAVPLAADQRLCPDCGEALVIARELATVEDTPHRPARVIRRFTGLVIARKIPHCSKNERGARTYAVMKTLFVTLSLRTKSVVAAFAGLLRGDPLLAACER